MRVRLATMRAGRRLALLVFFFVALGTASAAARAFDFNDTSWEGATALLKLAARRLGPERVEVVGTLEYDVLSPSDGVLVLHPETTPDATDLEAFLRAGGRLALIDDYGLGSELLGRFRIQRLGPPLRPAESLRQNPNLAVAVPTLQNTAGQEQGRHPLAVQVEKVFTNHPTALGHPNLTSVLVIPAQDEPDATLALTGVIGRKGRLFAMGDPSVFINLMLRYPGNRRLAQNLIDYLVEDDTWGRRGGRLYLVSNAFGQSGRFEGRGGLRVEVGSALETVREQVKRTREKGIPDLFAAMLAALAIIGVLLWVGAQATRVYRQIMPRYALATPLVAQGGAAGRAAVLGAPSTPRVLALLELRTALIEGLHTRLRVYHALAPGELLNEIERHTVLSRRSGDELRCLLAELDQVAARVTRRERVRLGQVRLLALQKRVQALLEEMDHRMGRKSG
ncbi:DUF4350 domain-containing protein [Myxococcota bacterium]